MADDQTGEDVPSSAAPVLHVLRLTIEALTPLSPSTGEMELAQDNLITRDMNGLPQLYGPAIAGILRHLYADYYGGEAEADKLFGYIKHGTDEGHESRLEVSFGFVHDQDDKPVEELKTPEEIQKDAVLAFLVQDAPAKRDRVKLDAFGAADDGAKYDRTSIPRGARFSLEFIMEGEANKEACSACKLDNLLALFQCPYLRVGGNSRVLGKVQIVHDDGTPRAFYAAFDRSTDDGWEKYKTFRESPINDQTGFDGYRKLPALDNSNSERRPITATITLRPSHFWRFGGGEAPLIKPDKDETPADIKPLTEPIILYVNCKGEVLDSGKGGVVNAPFTASGLKGALAHRTEFHLNRMKGKFADKLGNDEFASRIRQRASDALFGSMKREGGGQAGCVLLDDVFLAIPAGEIERRAGRIARNALDRFTQGVRDTALFTEEALYKGEVQISLCLLTHAWDPEAKKFRPLPKELRAAFDMALADLFEGRLGVGGGPVFDAFKDIHVPGDGRPENPNWKYWDGKLKADPATRVPVFYITQDGLQCGTVKSFGLAMMFKLAHELSVHDVLRSTSARHLDDSIIDLPDAIFGRLPGKDKKPRGLKSRVDFEPIIAVGQPVVLKGNKWDEARVLSSPKASFYPAYIRQPHNGKGSLPGVQTGKYASYTPDNTPGMPEEVQNPQLAGIKIYPVRDDYDLPSYPQEIRNFYDWNTKQKTAAERQATLLRPLDKDTKFTGRIYFHNLRPFELGALLWALTLGDSKLRHKIGMGRPLGLGEISIQIEGLEGIYNELEKDLREKRTGDHAFFIKEFTKEMKKVFEAHKAEHKQNGKEWMTSEQVATFLAASNPVIGKTHEQRLQYLPRPEDFSAAKNSGYVLATYPNP